jgi:hypothetical protein
VRSVGVRMHALTEHWETVVSVVPLLDDACFSATAIACSNTTTQSCRSCIHNCWVSNPLKLHQAIKRAHSGCLLPAGMNLTDPTECKALRHADARAVLVPCLEHTQNACPTSAACSNTRQQDCRSEACMLMEEWAHA